VQIKAGQEIPHDESRPWTTAHTHIQHIAAAGRRLKATRIDQLRDQVQTETARRRITAQPLFDTRRHVTGIRLQPLILHADRQPGTIPDTRHIDAQPWRLCIAMLDGIEACLADRSLQILNTLGCETKAMRK
jgi:hypothetical protein